MASNGNAKGTIRFAVIGLGHFAQTAILPAFASAKNCKLVALFSNDATKLDELKRKYDVKHALPYEGYDEFIRGGAVDAVYIALPNDMHCDYTLRAAAARVHVLCEKPMAINSDECERMIAACEEGQVKLMIAYRLHFEEANLSTVELLNGGKLGEPRYFTSAFSQQVSEGNIRTKAARGGGPIFDIGIYCINAVRYLFRAEPTEVFAYRASKAGDDRFREIDEQMSVVMQFPEQRLASFTCGFGASKEGFYDVVCTNGRVRLDPAYDHARDLQQEICFPDGKIKTNKFKKRDQVAAELVYFADCIGKGKAPEPSGREGLADVRVIEAIHQSARTKYAVPVKPIGPKPHPSIQQEHKEPPHDKPETVHAQAPSR